jgi:hypothetical protein
MLSKINRQQNTPNRPIRAVFVVILPLVAAIIALSGCIRHDFNFQAPTIDFPVTLTNVTITAPEEEAATGCATLPQTGLGPCYQVDEAAGDSLTDLIGGNHVQLGSAVGSDTNDPAWGTNGGEPVLIFDGVDNYGVFASKVLDGGDEATVIVLLNLVGGSPSAGGILGLIAGTSPVIRIAYDGLNPADIRANFRNSSTHTHDINLSTGTNYVVTMRFNGSVIHSIVVNDFAVSVSATPTAGTSTAGATHIGVQNGLYVNVELGGLAIYSRYVTDEEVSAIYAAWKAFKPGLSLP